MMMRPMTIPMSVAAPVICVVRRMLLLYFVVIAFCMPHAMAVMYTYPWVSGKATCDKIATVRHSEPNRNIRL